MRYKSNIPRIQRQLEQNKKAALEAIGVFVKGEAEVRAPVDTGRLAGSIDYRRAGDNKVVIGTPVEYAPYVEFGTSKMRAQPYLRPALDDNRKRIKELAEQYLGRGIE